MYKIPAKKLIFLRIITCVIIVFALISTVVAGFFVVYSRTRVNGLSMYPTLNSTYEQIGKRDIIYINRFAKVKKGDIIVLDLRKHDFFMNYAVKRLIATEGDIVNISFDIDNMEYNLILNGEIIESKPYKDLGYNTYSCFKQYVSNHEADSSRISKNDQDEVDGVIIKKGEIFVLGDNWELSKDSSRVGPLSIKTIVGRVDIVVKPSQNEFWAILKQIF